MPTPSDEAGPRETQALDVMRGYGCQLVASGMPGALVSRGDGEEGVREHRQSDQRFQECQRWTWCLSSPASALLVWKDSSTLQRRSGHTDQFVQRHGSG